MGSVRNSTHVRQHPHIMAQVLVVYPSGPSFDLDYYLKKHMPLVAETWTPHGLLNWEVLTFQDDAPYQVQATLYWESMEAFERAAGQEGTAKIFADIPNYTTAQAIILKGRLSRRSRIEGPLWSVDVLRA